MDDETTKLNAVAGRAIAGQEYGKAIAAVLHGSGDLHIAALLAIARELSAIAAALPLAGKGY